MNKLDKIRMGFDKVADTVKKADIKGQVDSLMADPSAFAGSSWDKAKVYGSKAYSNFQAGQYDTMLNVMGGSAAQGAIGGAAVGAFSDDRTMVGGAMTGAMMGAGLGAAGKKYLDYSKTGFSDKIRKLNASADAGAFKANKMKANSNRMAGSRNTIKEKLTGMKDDFVSGMERKGLEANSLNDATKAQTMSKRMDPNYDYGLEKRVAAMGATGGMLASNVLDSNDPY